MFLGIASMFLLCLLAIFLWDRMHIFFENSDQCSLGKSGYFHGTAGNLFPGQQTNFLWDSNIFFLVNRKDFLTTGNFFSDQLLCFLWDSIHVFFRNSSTFLCEFRAGFLWDSKAFLRQASYLLQ